MTERPPRLRPIPPGAVAKASRAEPEVPDAELLDRLAAALDTLPPAERAAAVVAIGLDEGVEGVAAGLDIPAEDADALTRNALQLLRGALAGIDPDDRTVYARGRRRRRTGPPRPEV